MLTLYHWEPNANSGKPIMAAYEKGVEFESRYVDLLGFEQHEPDYLKINPNGTIPAMVHDGQRSTARSRRRKWRSRAGVSHSVWLTLSPR
jgi:glutathione S-transferase